MNFPLKIYGRGGLFGGTPEPPASPVTADDNLFSDSIVRFTEVISEGPIVGLSQGDQSIGFDTTPYANADSSKNFEGITWDIRLGDPNQDWMPGFTSVENETGVGVNVKVSTGAVTRSSTLPDLDALQVTMRFPRMMKTENNGDINGTSVTYSVEYRHNTDVSWTPFPGSPFTKSGKTSAGTESQHYALVRPATDTRLGPWLIRVTRITQDNDADVQISDQIVWQSFTEVIEAKMTYPDTAYVGMEVKATSFAGGVPLRTYDVMGRIIRVPSNYDTLTREYTGIWNGTFKLAWCNNPAWCLLDMLTHTRYGLAIPLDKIDTAGLYTIAKYCDEPISDGQGGTVPRYTLNVQITDQKDAYDVLNDICSNFRAMIYYATGGVAFSQDSPRAIDMVVNPADVVEGDFDYQTQSYQDTPNVVLVAWRNPLLRDKGDIEVVEDQRDVSKRRAITSTYEAFGVREQFRARMMGRWALYSGFNDGEVVVYRASLDHMDVMPGWVVSIKDPLFDPIVSGGRAIQRDGNDVVLDRNVVIESLQSYTLQLTLPDKTLGSFMVTNSPGTTNRLTVTPQPPVNIEGSIWGLQATNLEERLYRVISRGFTDKMQVEITGIRYRPDKYPTVESLIAIEADQYLNPQGLTINPPSSLSIEEFITTAPNGGVRPGVS